ncbi:hypothetical protein ACO0KY_17900 [Undibacterium sp. Dicai25W]|uniref:hypothetical protein n=1 Tax=Undibacterium sp. Dicai25W TaxID=3413034 RepID=UPI003BF3641B
MAVVLKKLIAQGIDRPTAGITFASNNCLIRGPSDTGKSYIRDCLWYLLGGEKVPKYVPEADGYQTIALEFHFDDEAYIVQRALAGGSSTIYKRVAISDSTSTPDQLSSQSEDSDPLFNLHDWKPLDVDLSELMVKLAGASGKKILRSKSKMGDVTGTDLRHWFLLSQPTIISESPTSGSSHTERPQRTAAFHLFLTGTDDSSIALTKSKAEQDRAAGALSSAEDGIRRALAGIPTNTDRKETVEALERVDQILNEMTKQYELRAHSLKAIRQQIVDKTEALATESARMKHSASMLERFELLFEKYDSDLNRLNAIDEGVAYFQALHKAPCPLCGTEIEQNVLNGQPNAKATDKYRIAVAAEANKIRALRSGLLNSLEHERVRLQAIERNVREFIQTLDELEHQEERQLKGARIEFEGDPKTLAMRRSELSAILNLFDEVERLHIEIEKLKSSKQKKTAPISRDGGNAAAEVASHAKSMLIDWGFKDITSVRLDTDECDLYINERERLSYGAGKRGLFLTALTIALMRHSLKCGFPHLGVVVIDSPLKAYADQDPSESDKSIGDVPLAAVKDNFYAWLAGWAGPGQIILLENEKISAETAEVLKPIQFTRRNDQGRAGFYLKSVEPLFRDA